MKRSSLLFEPGGLEGVRTREEWVLENYLLDRQKKKGLGPYMDLVFFLFVVTQTVMKMVTEEYDKA